MAQAGTRSTLVSMTGNAHLGSIRTVFHRNHFVLHRPFFQHHNSAFGDPATHEPILPVMPARCQRESHSMFGSHDRTTALVWMSFQFQGGSLLVRYQTHSSISLFTVIGCPVCSGIPEVRLFLCTTMGRATPGKYVGPSGYFVCLTAFPSCLIRPEALDRCPPPRLQR